MPKYTEFTMNIPEGVDTMAQDMMSASNSMVTDPVSASLDDLYMSIQTKTMSNTLDIIQQHKIFSDPNTANSIAKRNSGDLDTIYGKAELLLSKNSLEEKENLKEEIANNYKKASSHNSKNLPTIIIEVDGKKTELENLKKSILHYYNTKNFNDHALGNPGSESYPSDPLLTELTMDLMVDYLQDTQDVEISKEQRNFLRTQWNNSNITSSASNFLSTGYSGLYLEPKKETQTFVFKNKKLVGLQSTQEQEDLDKTKSSTINVNADISHLRGEKSEQNPNLSNDDWIPQNSGRISIQYSSDNGLAIEVDDSIVKAMGKNISGKVAHQSPKLNQEEQPDLISNEVKEEQDINSPTFQSKPNFLEKIMSKIDNFISNIKVKIKKVFYNKSNSQTTNEETKALNTDAPTKNIEKKPIILNKHSQALLDELTSPKNKQTFEISEAKDIDPISKGGSKNSTSINR